MSCPRPHSPKTVLPSYLQHLPPRETMESSKLFHNQQHFGLLYLLAFAKRQMFIEGLNFLKHGSYIGGNEASG